MKKILFSFLIFSLLLSMQLNANIIFHNNVYDAQKQGLKEAKIIVFIIASSSCHFCHKLLN
ncbi:thioredoxin family protein, partial [Helicobacter apodemus]